MVFREVGLSESEYKRIIELLGREPNDLELELIGVMWSEHCSYKSTRPLLRTFPSKGKYVLQGQGENAGVVDMGEGWGFAFKVESHNHPSAVAPFQGAATGVGGIIRDIIAMGARPSVSMDGLFFGDASLQKTRNLAKGIVEGIGSYGNAVGVPIVGGKTFYSPCYNDNPLVNAFSAGFVRLDKMASSQTAKPGDYAVLLGSKTGRDGIAGASFASRELDEDSKASKPQIQIGDPFEEKLLIECCMDLLDKKLIASMQDMGAAGILSSSSEIAHKSGCGIDIQVEKIPLREADMLPWEIFLSESQERMLLIVEEEKLEPVFAMAKHYGLDCAIVGEMTDSKRYRVYKNGVLEAELPTSILGDTPEILWPAAEPKDLPARQAIELSKLASADPAKDLLEMLSCPNGHRKDAIWEQYDSMVQLHTIAGPGEPAAIVEVPETHRACVLTMEAEPYKCWTDPYTGASEAMALSLRGLWLTGADALGMTNCLNFASPEVPEKFYELMECLRGLADTCRALDCPVVSGNVSLYNETATDRIYPTPLVVTAGLVVDRDRVIRAGRTKAGDFIYLVGAPEGSLGATRYQQAKDGKPLGKTAAPDAEAEKAFRDRALKTAQRQLANSGRVVAGGGLAAALANEAIASGVGMDIELAPRGGVETLLFSEGGARAVYAVSPEKAAEFEAAWSGIPCVKAGKAGGDKFSWQGILTLPLEELAKAFTEEK
ncbi:MAG: phosphoribosylformylglycinamidine synthase subunit PurL [Cloacibacillus porcorum]|uniref:phosphoribosylformylglycinamidine synthase subunit PurL n=1 Tax=Cloacibacillus porcorum TaxID=1197717 RepID=UPI0023EFF318|nr:phosphoribosylformylglycinamidine synthase subunit PurL [Cloacibacillus porcorum]MCD7875823.1 phosphoribosylformylglycinamidine synthase subunit PurL [Cloacibacillus porcorum]